MGAPNTHGLTQHIQQGPRRAVAITPSDTVDLTAQTRMIYVGTTGHLAVILADDAGPGTSVILKNFAAGTWQPLAVSRVLATGTTAVDIVGGW